MKIQEAIENAFNYIESLRESDAVPREVYLSLHNLLTDIELES